MLARQLVPTIIALTGDEQDRLIDGVRTEAVAEFLSRREECPLAKLAAVPTDSLLFQLAKAGNLVLRARSGGQYVVGYVPSMHAAKEIRSARPSIWPSTFVNRIAREVKSTHGAIFYFPDEFGDGKLEVFITDWSPCPAACAVAVHSQHRYAAGFADQDGDVFTGQFVRHPLTGDLLPVWIAGWVKPDFGTGAVLVNPAHDSVDLAFGRRIGLPIRFALELHNSSSGGIGWSTPPIVKTGYAVRTGTWDGIDYLAASTAYLETLIRRGLAVRHEDVRLPMTDIAVLDLSPDGPISIDVNVPRVVPARESTKRYKVTAGAALSAAAAIASGGKAVLVASSRAQKSCFQSLISLLIDNELASQNLVKIYTVQTIEQTKLRDHPLFSLAVLIAARLDQPAVVRQQLLEQLERFTGQHAAITHTWMFGTARMDDREEFARVQPKLAASFEGLDLPTAFKLTYALQKDIVSGNTQDPSQVAAYLMSAYLLGLSQMPSVSVINDAYDASLT